MMEWKDVLQTVVSKLGSDAIGCILEFVRVLPEEVTEGRKINLTVCSTETPSALGEGFGAMQTGVFII